MVGFRGHAKLCCDIRMPTDGMAFYLQYTSRHHSHYTMTRINKSSHKIATTDFHKNSERVRFNIPPWHILGTTFTGYTAQPTVPKQWTTSSYLQKQNFLFNRAINFALKKFPGFMSLGTTNKTHSSCRYNLSNSCTEHISDKRHIIQISLKMAVKTVDLTIL